jgi:energy-converting hydrogenase Eha subunit H
MSEIILFIAVIILAVINRLQAGSNYKKKFEIKVRLIEPKAPKVKKKKDKLKSRVIERFEPEVEGYEAKENPYPSGKVEL